MKIKVTHTARHRNGVGGEPFHVVMFTWNTHRMAAFVFDTQGYVAVTCVTELAAGNIKFANGNSWRGDDFEDDLRKAITEWDAAETARYMVGTATAE